MNRKSDGRESPCPPADEANGRRQFALWKAHGDVIAAVFGHDHVNDFDVVLDGIHLIQTFGAGYHTYGEMGGARLIVLNEAAPTAFTTESIRIPRITQTRFR